MTSTVVCKIAAKRLLSKALQLRKEHAGSLLKTTKTVQGMVIAEKDFGEGCHMATTEPYFYDSAYQHIKRDHALVIDENGKCLLANEVNTEREDKKHGTKKPPMRWECTSECKVLTDSEVGSILDLKKAFERPIQDVRKTLDTCDSDCPNQHNTKCCNGVQFELRGHPLVCSNDGGCHSQLRILRSAATHFPVLTTFLRHVCCALESHKTVHSIDEALCTGDFHTLMEIT